MPDVVYVKGSLVNGMKFPRVSVYNAVLEAPDRNTFDAVFKALLPESTLAVLDEHGAVLVVNGSAIRIYLRQQELPSQNAKGSKQSSFVNP